MRNKKLNDVLRSKRSTKHKAKFGNKIDRARAKHLQKQQKDEE